MAWAHKSISMLSLLEKTDDTDGKKEKTKREIQKAALLPKYICVSLVPA